MAVGQIAIFGGSFDPVHNGHTAVVDTLDRIVNPDRILLLPSGNPPHRAPLVANSRQRLQMLELVVTRWPNVEIDTRELEREGLSYSYLTLTELRAEHPEAKLLLVLGWDSLASFITWYRWRDILNMACLLVVARDTGDRRLPKEFDLPVHEWGEVEPDTQTVIELPFVQIPCASTEVRRRLAAGLTVEPFICPEVIDYIEKNNIYRGPILPSN